MRSTRVIGVVGALCFLVTGFVRGASLGINDTAANGSIVVSAGQFEGGFTANSVVLNPIQTPLPGNTNESGSTTITEPAVVQFSGVWISNTGSESSTIYFVESQNQSLVSDILTYQISPNSDGRSDTITGSFTSYSDPNLPALPGGISPSDVFVENGGAYTFSADGLGASITSSDAEATPLPSSAWAGMVLLGGLGLVTAARRRMSTRAI